MKGEGLPLTMIVIAVIVLVTALIVIFGFKTLWGEGLKDAEDKQNKANDKDYDGIIDLFDVCPCTPGREEFDGCTVDYKAPGTDLKKLQEAGCKK